MYHFDWIKRHSERTPEKLALVDAATHRCYTYSQLNMRANQVASFLNSVLGIQPGERVSILAQNNSEYYEILFGCSKAGIILNTLNWRLTLPELEFILNDCQPRLLFYEGIFSEKVTGLKGRIPCDLFVVIDGSDITSDYLYEDSLELGSPAGVELQQLTYNDTWCIIYTSGTTGQPKGAQVTYGNFFYNAIGMGQAIDLSSEDVNLNVLPTFHIGGLGLYAAPTLHAGGTVVVMRSFDSEQLLQLIENYRVTKLLLVPSIYFVLAQFPEFDRYDISSVQSWGSGGSALPPTTVEEFASRGIIIQQGFGMTETGPTVFMIGKDDAVRKAGSVGKPVMHTDVCIKDRDGNDLGVNVIGELCIRGGNVTTGYWNKPQETAQAIVDGWLHSGDAAMYDEEGFYYIVDRWKDMYISGGENVYPAEVENVIYQIPSVKEVAVIGVPHPKWQEVGCAVVVIKDGQILTEGEVIAFCEGRLAQFKIPKSVIFIDKLPRTAAGKVLKRELRDQYKAY